LARRTKFSSCRMRRRRYPRVFWGWGWERDDL
jgi:hypothetical protein